MTTNRRAKFLPSTLADKYTEAVHDPELLNLREDLGLIEIRLSQLLSKIETSDPREKWIEFSQTIAELENAITDGEIGSAERLVRQLGERAKEKLEDYAVWQEIMDLIESRRRVTESESNRLVRMQQMITAEDVFKLVERLLSAIKRYVKDPHIYAAIANEFAIATGAAHNGILERGTQKVQPDRSGGMDQGELLGSGTQGADPAG